MAPRRTKRKVIAIFGIAGIVAILHHWPSISESAISEKFVEGTKPDTVNQFASHPQAAGQNEDVPNVAGIKERPETAADAERYLKESYVEVVSSRTQAGAYESAPESVVPPFKSTASLESQVDISAANSELDGGVFQTTPPATAQTDAVFNNEPTVGIQTAPSIPVVPAAGLPDRKPHSGTGDDTAAPVDATGSSPHYDWQNVDHWEKRPEQFPLKTDDIIQLPSGVPKKFPEIQFQFGAEAEADKEKRLARRTKVKNEMIHAWKGYKRRAWMHDEVKPVSGGVTDPFCGWAATMVDALDTLWIMEMKEEFEEAVLAIDKLDFATATRDTIPVFETTIRYLGGLLAAYDVSGAKYPILLKKAEALAVILMEAFDTPNRMPVLYLPWRPQFAAQPKRAGTRSNFAELGSLTMEFTRLAQLTKNAKYYDAVARITNELVKWQKTTGTKLKGVFPDNVDAQGCNKTAPAPVQILDEATLSDAGSDDLVDNSANESVADDKSRYIIDPMYAGNDDVVHGGAGPAKYKGSEHAEITVKRGLGERALSHKFRGTTLANRSRGNNGDWDCVPQGLTGNLYGMEMFSMGGGQDSSYEYFTKMHLLLGGLAPEYEALYRGTTDAIKNHMLFRPMIPDEKRNILFSAKVGTYGHPEADNDLSYTYEITHLTCFIGGMMGMGAKVFNLNGDMGIAERLTDGCVWAYEATQSGIMPETASGVPCENLTSCPWDDALWKRYLDPLANQRQKQIDDWEADQVKLEANKKEKVAKAKAQADELAAKDEEHRRAASIVQAQSHMPKSKAAYEPEATQYDAGAVKPTEVVQAGAASAAGFVLVKDEVKLSKRAPVERPADTYDPAGPAPVAEAKTKKPAAAPKKAMPSIESPLEQSEDEDYAVYVSPRPQTHDEYVTGRIRLERLPKGFAGIDSDKYILR